MFGIHRGRGMNLGEPLGDCHDGSHMKERGDGVRYVDSQTVTT